jgi:two-component system cell cycle sensor histidine kinase/response regulator CckA
VIARYLKDTTGKSPRGPGARQAPPARETVLLVEDDEAVRLLARLALETHGYRVLAAASGDQAIEVARHHLGTIHLVVTDIQMPGIRGPDLAPRIASLRPGIKILFMSGYLDSSIAAQEKLASNAVLLDKPFSIEALASKVRELLDS